MAFKTKREQLIEEAQGLAKGTAINELGKEGLEQAGVDAADVGGYLAAAKGLYSGGKILASDADADAKMKGLTNTAQDTGAGIATGGIYNIGKFAGDKLTSGGVSKVQDKYNKMFVTGDTAKALNPVGWGFNKAMEKGLGFFDSGKGEDQQRRDNIRKTLQKAGFLDKDWQMSLANGGRYDIGRDGGARDEAGRGILELDFSNAKAGDAQSVAIGNVNPLAAIVTGGDKKLLGDFATYFTKGTMSNADGNPEVIKANAIQQYTNAGLDAPKALQAIKDLEAAGKVTTDEAIAYQNGINMLFGGGGSPQQASQRDRGETTGGSRKSKPKPKRTADNTGNTSPIPVPTRTPVTLSQVSGQGYDDNFVNSLAKIYSQAI